MRVSVRVGAPLRLQLLPRELLLLVRVRVGVGVRDGVRVGLGCEGATLGVDHVFLQRHLGQGHGWGRGRGRAKGGG